MARRSHAVHPAAVRQGHRPGAPRASPARGAGRNLAGREPAMSGAARNAGGDRAGRQPAMIDVVLNGRPHRGPVGMTVADAVAALSPARAGARSAGGAAPAADGRGIAVAVNGEVVRRADWPATALANGDQVEVLTAAQGG